MTFVVVGGGPTGVELAGAIAELAHFVLARDSQHLSRRGRNTVAGRRSEDTVELRARSFKERASAIGRTRVRVLTGSPGHRH